MIIVIVAGGLGTRLWPLSTAEYPKHLLRLTQDKSLLQNTYDRAKLLTGYIYVISETSHINEVYAQLPKVERDHIIVEPGRRGTASCVIAALAHIKGAYDQDEPIVFMHSDHHIRDLQGFVDTVTRAADVSAEHRKIVLLGVEPSHAATGFGYIERGESKDGGKPIYDVISFTEKPDRVKAEKYLESGNYLWNMGYFVAPLGVFESNIEKYAPHLWRNYQRLLSTTSAKEHEECYLAFESEPIDTALIEHVADLLVIPGTFDWMDVGSYPDIHQVNHQDDLGNVIQGNVETDLVTNSFIRNDTELPVAVIGLDNVAVINTPQGILVINKTHAQKVGDVAKRIQEQ